MKFKIDWFLVGLAAAVGLAWLLPEGGAQGGILHPELLNKLGVALIFFLNGVALSPEALKAGTLRWPVHLVIQGCTYVVLPLLGLLGGWVAPELRLGFFYLGVIPSTISSAVVLTATAHGNVPAAVFNATLSSVLGVVLTPLWLGWMLSAEGQSPPLGKVLADLLVWLVLPLILGQMMRPRLGAWALRHKKFIQWVDRGAILFLVYTSFCDSVQRGVWSGHGVGTVASALLGATAMLVVVILATGVVCDRLGFPWEDRIAAVFCGSTKSLATGVAMAQVMLGTHPDLGLILLPLMLYHPLQLVVCGVLAGRWAKS